MPTEFIMNGQASGSVASVLMANQFDPACLRPYTDSRYPGRNFISHNSGMKDDEGNPIYNSLVTNAPATLRKDEWITMDRVIIKAAKERLGAVADLRSRGLQHVIANGMGSTVLQHETQSDITAATVSMDGMRRSDADRPEFNLVNLPLPIIHKDFRFSARQLAASRTGGSPLDTTTAELAARRVAEEAEKLLLGTAASYTYGGGTIYGYSNYPGRMLKTLTAPTAANHPTTVSEVLAMMAQSRAEFHYGPWMIYNSPAWDSFMDEDYSTAKGDNTLRGRLKAISGIVDVKSSDLLADTTLLLVQMTSDVVREVVGMDVTTVQWEGQGGMEINFKVMAILVPQLRDDFNGNTGIVHGTV